MLPFLNFLQELGDSVAYAPFFEDLRLLDLQRAKQVGSKQLV